MSINKMKAAICSKYGPPEVIQLKEVEKPTPKDNEILIKVYNTTVTAGDSRMRGFNVPISFWLPAKIALGFRKPRNAILGMELAGEVEVIGKNVTKFKKGDQVFAWLLKYGFGGYAQYKCLPEDALISLKMDNVSLEEIVTIPVGGRTALYFLREANIKPGQKVLIYGASGSVGTFAIQLAKYFGAEVTGVCSRNNVKLVESLGAYKVIDYTKEDFTKNGEIYDVIFDTVGKCPYVAISKSMREKGTFLQAVASPGISLRMKWTEVRTGKKMIGGGPPEEMEDMNFLQMLIDKGEIKPVIDRNYSLEEIVEAHRYVDTGRKKGNVVINIEH